MNLSIKFDIGAYCQQMEQYLGNQEGEARLFWQALSFAVSAHEGQKRKSGEVFVSHPCEVASILIEEMGVRDPETLAAAVLHDTIEDVPEVTNEVISEIFGEKVTTLVDGCTKISHFVGNRQSFYKVVHRKIFSSAASQVGIIMIKLADRLHNLRTMDSMPKHKRQKIADETLAIYAPLAKVMGLFSVKRELFNLALQYKFPRQSQKLAIRIRHYENSEECLEIRGKLEEEMKRDWVSCEIRIRARGVSAYYDYVEKVLTDQINLPVQIIIVVDDLQSCYKALGILNKNFPPIPRTIRDFIANPKPTGYQSLHAKANIKGKNYLFKIRTREMLQSARSGIINEWLARGKFPGEFEKEIREMFDILGTDEDIPYQELIAASGKKEIYTYTPKGDRICLPNQSLVLDFAFKVHTEVGSHCVAATVGQKRVSPDYILNDGDRVQIICSKKAVRFDPNIQHLCQSPRARSEIARLLRLRIENLAGQIGKRVVDQELEHYGIPAAVLEDDAMADILFYFGLTSLEDLYLQVGKGRIGLPELLYEIKNGIYAGQQTLAPPDGGFNRFELTTLDPVSVKLSRCCNPVPTETSLVGLLSERGLSVHRQGCNRLSALKVRREDIVELHWQLKQSMVEKLQTLLVLKATRNRVFLMLSTAPADMKIFDVIALSPSAAMNSDWEIQFRVDTLYSLRNVLNHFRKSGLQFEFGLEQ